MELLQEESTTEREPIAQLVLAAQQGDRQAFNELFDRYHRAVYVVVVRRLGNDAEAQELCQEVFIQAMQKIGQLQTPECFGGWLRAIARRMAINRAMRTRLMASLEADRVEASCVEYETPLGSILAQERHQQLHVGLNRLPDLDRDTLVAFYFRGRSIVEMSNEFASPIGTIKRRLHVARKRLAKELAELAPA
ncbi:MAG: sigma-70 family RNA polymerase sigma factor [Thermoguttaceae bacterium]|jgi:RNA polymerase sigma-70 factor (ECF subfamily)